MTFIRRPFWFGLCAFVLAVASPTVRALEPAPAAPAVAPAAAPAETPAPAAPVVPPVPQPMTVADAMAWRDAGAARLSDDGQWFAFTFNPNYGDGELIIRRTDADTTYRHARGGPATFSSDSQWAAFMELPPVAQSQPPAPGGPPGPPGAGFAGGGAGTSLILLRLKDGDKQTFARPASFAFSDRSAQWLAVQRRAPEGAPRAWRGTDLLLHELATGRETNIGNVADFAFDETGTWLAYVVDAEDKIGNGLYALRLRDFRTVVLDTLAKAAYSRLTWTDILDTEGISREALTALRAVEDKGFENPLQSVVGVRGFDKETPQTVAYDPAADESFPKGMTVSPNRTPIWNEARTALIFGIYDAKPKKPEAAEAGAPAGGEGARPTGGPGGPRPGGPGGGRPGGGPGAPGSAARPGGAPGNQEPLPSLVIWHWKDKRLQPQQRLQQNADRNFSYLCVWHVDVKKFVRLADDTVRTVSFGPRDTWAVGRDSQPYDRDASVRGVGGTDVYAINPTTGERRKLLDGERWVFGASPAGDQVLFYRGRDFYTLDLATGATRNLTAGVQADFHDEEDDHNIPDPPDGPVGWSSDGKTVLLSDGWDIWAVSFTGAAAQNLTGNGFRDHLRYGRFTLDFTERGIDLSKPLYFTVYGEQDKKNGYARRAPGGALQTLGWEAAGHGFQVLKARNADFLAFSRSSETTPAEWYVADDSFAGERKMTDVAAQLAPFVWSPGSMLLDFKNARGEAEQAALFLPAGYEKGKSYPCIVYIYEKLTDGLHRFQRPTYGGFSAGLYTSNGYAVLMPDITYRVNDPGVSAVECVVPAVDAAVATGIVDAQRVGLHGHSWGGYQTAFIVTQTDKFHAAIAGAALTDMASMYGLVYKNAGISNGAIFESSQGRFSAGPWELPFAYARNSPVMYAEKVTTPLMLLHNDLDGAVDFTQGVEYFTALRRLNKEVILLEYEGENHGLGRPENREDYSIRMMEFFNHHLKGDAAPQWYTDGIDMLKMKDHLDERAIAEAKAKADAAKRSAAALEPKKDVAQADGRPH